jgi:hypothetical protein
MIPNTSRKEALVVRVGESMENPVSGERFVWRATAASTGGEYCEFDLFLAPGARIAAARFCSDGCGSHPAVCQCQEFKGM